MSTKRTPNITTVAKGAVAFPLVDDETGELYGWDLHLELPDGIDPEPLTNTFGTLAECRAWLAAERVKGEKLNRLLGRGRWVPADLVRPF